MATAKRYIHHILFASYGNDSIALIQYAYEAGLENVTVAYSNTGWAAPWWADRVREAEFWLRGFGFTPVRIKSEGLLNLIKRKKAWPRQGMQFCTEHLKIYPAIEWMDTVDPDKGSVCWVGVQKNESKARESFPPVIEESPNHGGRRLEAPLLDHTIEERDALLNRAGWEILPHRSEECFPCINSNRQDLVRLADVPERIELIEKTEQEMGTTGKGKPRTMFRPYRHMGATGIREVVRWATSPRGKFDPDDGTGGGNCDTGMCGM